MPPCAAKPRVPIGTDPGGGAVAIIGTGVDYTRPDIAARLARDGEGEAIAWDFRDMDRAPYEPAGDGGGAGPGTAAASALLAGLKSARLVPLRPSGDPLALGGAARFVSRSPARVVLVTLATSQRQDWQVFAEIAARHPELLFVVAAGDEAVDLDSVPRFPASLGLANALVVSACDAAGNPLPGANTGARTVDVLIPVEPGSPAAQHDGKLVSATATAIAAARVTALAARLKQVASSSDGAKLRDVIVGSIAKPPPASAAVGSRYGWIEQPGHAERAWLRF